ncbi:MAG: hypothetical protein GEU83_16795 [Pseudonocardiaceae bacterium]|nr:hypothetical protein [Pseudonocardiaceae bacterium]
MTTSNAATGIVELPLGTEEEFAQLVAELVTDEAPRLFALVEEHGERVDGWILAWGMAFEDHVEIVGVDGGMRGSFPSVQRARWALSRRVKVRLVWVDTVAPLRPRSPSESAPEA